MNRLRRIASALDHSLLKPTFTDAELDQACAVARHFEVASVCSLPFAMPRCRELLAGSSVAPCTVIAFPLGAASTTVKVAEARQALADGARELDLVVNINQVLSGNWRYVAADIGEVLAVAHDEGRRVKVIFETCYLNLDHKRALCEICNELGADWVKTSTGFGSAGATPEDVRFLREHTDAAVQVKASGGIRTLQQVEEFLALGATRIGTSATEAILNAAQSRAEDGA
jgi:deoxyribose-phosphate aldolase